jgi:multidrug efflux system outer membrane protein
MRKDTRPLAQLPPERIRLAEDLKLARENWPEATWWKRFRDPQLDDLVQRALRDSPSLEVARQRIETGLAQARLVEAGSGLFVGVKGFVDRESVSEGGFLGAYGRKIPSLGTDGPRYTQATVGLLASYELDLWGKDRAKTNAALGVANARKAEMAQVELMVAANVTRLYFSLQTLFEQEALLGEVRKVRHCLAEAHEARAAQGLEALIPAQLSRTQLLEIEKQIVLLEGQERILREALRFLIGTGDMPEIRPVSVHTAEVALPACLGYELLSRRPDLQAFRWYVQASMDQVDAAKAAFYPSFDLRAFAGFDALHTNELLQKSSCQMNLIPGVSLPLFDSGRLNANLALARSQSNVLVAQYNEAVLAAVREVSQRAVEFETLFRRSALQEQKVRAAELVAKSAEACHNRGLADLATAEESSLPWLAERSFAIELRGVGLDAEVALIAALGGGYEAAASSGAPMPQYSESAKPATR